MLPKRSATLRRLFSMRSQNGSTYDPRRPRGNELPYEVVLQILESMPDLDTAVKAACTCRRFYTVWQNRLDDIADSIIHSSIFAPADALELASFQGLLPDCDVPTKFFQDAPTITSFQKRVFSNAKMAAWACDSFLEHIADEMASGARRPHRNPPYLTATEKERFHHAYYRVWIYILESHLGRLDQEGVRRMSYLEHWRMFEVAWWLKDQLDDTTFGHHMHHYPAAHFGCHSLNDFAVQRRCDNLKRAYVQKNNIAAHDDRFKKDRIALGEIYYAIFDCHQTRVHYDHPPVSIIPKLFMYPATSDWSYVAWLCAVRQEMGQEDDSCAGLVKGPVDRIREDEDVRKHFESFKETIRRCRSSLGDCAGEDEECAQTLDNEAVEKTAKQFWTAPKNPGGFEPLTGYLTPWTACGSITEIHHQPPPVTSLKAQRILL